MEKAYDLKELINMNKDDGLELAEDAAKIFVNNIFNWLTESALLSKNPYDDLIAVVLPVVKPKIMAALDKIDGEVEA